MSKKTRKADRFRLDDDYGQSERREQKLREKKKNQLRKQRRKAKRAAFD